MNILIYNKVGNLHLIRRTQPLLCKIHYNGFRVAEGAEASPFARTRFYILELRKVSSDFRNWKGFRTLSLRFSTSVRGSCFSILFRKESQGRTNMNKVFPVMSGLSSTAFP